MELNVSNGSELAANFTGIVGEASDTTNGGELVADASGIVPEPSAVTNDGEVAADYSGIVPEASDITNDGVITGIVPEASAVTNGGEIASYDTGIESQISLELGGGPEAENGEDNSRGPSLNLETKGIGSTDGVSGIQSEKIASAGSSDLYGEDLKNANISGTSSTYEDVDFVDEIEEELTDLDVEGVLKKQNTHDLYCPNCHSCITRRVILLRKKPKIRRKQRPERKLENNPASVRIEVRDIANISSNSFPTPAAPDDQNYDGEREAFRCLSCLSFFIPAGDGFRIFKAFGESKKNEILPAPEPPVHQGRTNWFFSIFAPREKKTAFDQVVGQSLSEAATIGQRVQSQSPDDMSASYQRDQMGASAYHGESANPPKELIAEAKTVKQAVSGQNDFSSLKGASAELFDQGKQVYELTGTQKSGKGGSNSFTDIPIFIAVGERSDGAMIDDNKEMDSIATLQRGRTTRRIRLRVLRVTDAFSANRILNVPGLDIIAADEQGNAIHMVVDAQSSAYYRSKMKEGTIYTFTNVACIAAQYYRPVNRDNRLRITLGTQLIEEQDTIANIKRSHFEFVSFSDVSGRIGKNVLLTDLIGVIVKVVNPTMCNSKGGGEGCFSKFYIQDLSGKELAVTLWGDLNTEFRNFNILESNGSTIIVLCAMNIKKFDDEVYASNLSLSKLFINLEIPEAIPYFDRFNPSRLIPEVIDNAAQAKQVLRKGNSPQSKTISNLLDVANGGVNLGERYLCFGEITGFNLDKGWFYTACKKCTSKLEQTADGTFCKKCNTFKVEPMPWYKIDTIVKDATGSTIFTAFGDYGTKLIGAPINTLINTKVMDPECLHPLMERIIGLSRTFEVSVKKNDFVSDRFHINVHNVFIDILDKSVSSSTSSSSEESVHDRGNKRGFDQINEEVSEPFYKKVQVKIEKP